MSTTETSIPGVELDTIASEPDVGHNGAAPQGVPHVADGDHDSADSAVSVGLPPDRRWLTFAELARRDPDLARTCLHEAAHAVASRALGRPVAWVAVGHDAAVGFALPALDAEAVRRHAIIAAAAPVATALYFGNGEDGGERDRRNLTGHVRQLVGLLGTDDDRRREETLAYRRAGALVRRHLADIECVAAELFRFHRAMSLVERTAALEDLD